MPESFEFGLLTTRYFSSQGDTYSWSHGLMEDLRRLSPDGQLPAKGSQFDPFRTLSELGSLGWEFVQVSKSGGYSGDPLVSQFFLRRTSSNRPPQ